MPESFKFSAKNRSGVSMSRSTMWSLISHDSLRESWKTDPSLRGVPTDYSADYPIDYPRTFLNKQPNLRLQGKETQEAYSCTCSTYTTITIWKRLPFSFHQLRWPSHFFIFTPLFISHMLKARFLHGLLNTFILICFKCLPSTLTFAVKQLFWTFLTSGEIEIIEDDAWALQTSELN